MLLIVRVDCGTDGPERLGARAAAEGHGDKFPRRGLAEETRTCVVGHGLGSGLVLEHKRSMGKPQVGSDRRCGVGKSLLDSEGGSAATDLVGARVRAEPKLESECELVFARARCRGMPILGSRGPGCSAERPPRRGCACASAKCR